MDSDGLPLEGVILRDFSPEGSCAQHEGLGECRVASREMLRKLSMTHSLGGRDLADSQLKSHFPRLHPSV
jgi:hypothetical protein